MSRTEARQIVKRYIAQLEQAHFPITAVYMFGSQAKGSSGKWSDIDIAIISERLEKNRDRNESLLWRLRRNVDLRIEPHGFTPKDFADDANPMAWEIRKTGLRIK